MGGRAGLAAARDLAAAAGRVLLIAPPLPGAQAGDFVVPSEDGREL